MGDPLKLLAEIEERLAKAKSGDQAKLKNAKPKRTPPNESEANLARGTERTGKSVVRDHERTGKSVVRDQKKSPGKPLVRGKSGSTGPRTSEGKARASANSLKHGFYASVAKLNPRDSDLFHATYGDLRSALHPDGPAEEHLIRELAVFSARLQTLEAAQFALIAGHTEGTPAKIDHPEHYTDGDLLDMRQPDARDVAAAYERTLDTLERLNKIETHLRRAYNRTWDRLERMQKERLKMPLDEMLKRTQAWLNAEARRTNRPQDIPARDSRIDEKGKLITYTKDHPLWRPSKQEEEDDLNGKRHKIE